MNDNNDPIRIALTGSLAMAKFVAGATGDTTYAGITAPAGYARGESSAQPGQNISYRIMAKNNYSTAVNNFLICDTVPANTTLVSVSGGNLYRVGGNWSTSAPAAGTAAGTEICVANGTLNGTQATLAPLAATTTGTADEFNVDFVVKVN
ncbi:hypothetical protein ACFP81_07140 [Deinococcus lacus]|uniref:DUF11 domain-containing protein n=1 Tax=Deinococcus lacus TaxID=392561 RepID=A0ABW1YBV1_9DEIO